MATDPFPRGKRSLAGHLPDGREVEAFDLACGPVSVRILSYGGIVQSLRVPDRHGTPADIVLGYGRIEDYLAHPDEHFGALIGRYANRIAGGRFTLDGAEYRLPVNDGANTIHGGPDGFDRQLWQVESAEATRLVLAHVSPDGHAGFPGRLGLRATYRLEPSEGGAALHLSFEAETDRPTVLNPTNHSYFNLAGEGSGSIEGHELEIPAEAIVAIDGSGIPSGEIRPVEGTPFDFRRPTALGARLRDGRDLQLVNGRGYDHCYVLPAPESGLRRAARLRHPGSGRVLEVLTTEPGVQLYTGNFLTGQRVGKTGRLYRQGDAVCFETGFYPDAPNHPAFPSPVLRPGEVFKAETVYRFTTG